MIAAARRLDWIADLVSLGAIPITLDVTWQMDRISEAISVAIARVGKIDILVNNTGSSCDAPAKESVDTEPLEQVQVVKSPASSAPQPSPCTDSVEIDLLGRLKVTQALLPHLRENRSGVIAFVSRSSGLCLCAGRGLHNATKLSAEGMGEILSEELKPFGVQVLLFQPVCTPPFKQEYHPTCFRAHRKLSILPSCATRMFTMCSREI